MGSVKLPAHEEDNMKLYIAGRITGDENYKAKFEKAKRYCESKHEGIIAIIPAVLPEGMEPADYMRICLAMIDGADAVAFLPDYRASKGAMLEYAWCKYTGKPIIRITEEELKI